MRLKKKERNTVWRKVTAVLLLCGLILPMSTKTQAKALEVDKGKITIYQYDWINSYDELMSTSIFPEGEWVDIMLAWDNTSSDKSWGDGKIWYAADVKNEKGQQTYQGDNNFNVDNFDYDYFGYKADPSWYIGGDSLIPEESEFFFTQHKLGHMQLKRVGEDDNKNNYSKTDSGNKISPTFRMAMTNSEGKQVYFGEEKAYGRNGSYWVNMRLVDGEEAEDRYQAYDLTVQLFAESSKKDQKNYRCGTVNIFANIESFFGTDDYYFKHKSNSVRMEQDDNENAWDRTFRIYTRTAREVDVFVDDVVVEDSWVFRVDQDVLLPDDATITVKDGGVMAVNSHLLLNGKIIVEEGGTVIINEGAAVGPYSNENPEAGSFDIRGGNVVVMDDAKLMGDDAESYIYISGGGSLINRGLVTTGSLNLSDASRFLNEEGAHLVMGYTNVESRSTLPSDSIEQIVNRMTLPCSNQLILGRLDISGRSQLINEGTVKVYHQELAGGISNISILASRTAGTICGNQGSGVLNGSFGYAERDENGYAVKYKLWPNGWPDVTAP